LIITQAHKNDQGNFDRTKHKNNHENFEHNKHKNDQGSFAYKAHKGALISQQHEKQQHEDEREKGRK
jgi:hypothetical protein